MVRLWCAETGEPIGQPLSATNCAVALDFSPDSRTVLAGSSDGVRMWDVTTGQKRGESLRLRGMVKAVAFSPDGSHRGVRDGDGGRVVR
ncbi:MAG: WD40 repeat domain-containing protein [Candidatus Saccharimonadales bacterium]